MQHPLAEDVPLTLTRGEAEALLRVLHRQLNEDPGALAESGFSLLSLVRKLGEALKR